MWARVVCCVKDYQYIGSRHIRSITKQKNVQQKPFPKRVLFGAVIEPIFKYRTATGDISSANDCGMQTNNALFCYRTNVDRFLFFLFTLYALFALHTCKSNFRVSSKFFCSVVLIRWSYLSRQTELNKTNNASLLTELVYLHIARICFATFLVFVFLLCIFYTSFCRVKIQLVRLEYFVCRWLSHALAYNDKNHFRMVHWLLSVNWDRITVVQQIDAWISRYMNIQNAEALRKNLVNGN